MVYVNNKVDGRVIGAWYFKKTDPTGSFLIWSVNNKNLNFLDNS